MESPQSIGPDSTLRGLFTDQIVPETSSDTLVQTFPTTHYNTLCAIISTNKWESRIQPNFNIACNTMEILYLHCPYNRLESGL